MQLSQPNIQPFNSLTTQYFDVGVGKMNYEVSVNDIDDWVYPSIYIHQWARKRDGLFGGLNFFADILNEFGAIGGFEIIEELYNEVANGNFDATVGHILTIH